jgi:hypothetical protein
VSSDQLIRAICDQNLAVYRASVTRLREDVGQEAEIAHDYRGRIVYELLQNADDAMAGAPTHQDAVWIQLTDTDLWFGNSGRPLDEDDVRGLCGIGASHKGAAVGRRRASIGHKGMGFKSVLEVTDAPEVISESYAFRLGRDLARGPVEALMRELGEPAPARVPAMRFPETLAGPPREWEEAHLRGIRTLFRFPLRSDMDDVRRARLADRLLGLPVTAIVFLKHLERIDVEVDAGGRTESIGWQVTRERRTDSGWSEVPGLAEPGIYRITVSSADVAQRQFLVAHNNQLEIREHRGGLDSFTWEGIELSEVAVAAELAESDPIPLASESRVLHVFLPTEERCPYPLLINGAFSADLSRQEVRVSEDPSDYNRWLLSEATRLFGESLMPALRELGASDSGILALLDRGAIKPEEPAASRTAEVAVSGMRDALSRNPAVSLATGDRVPVSACVVPPLVDDESAGTLFRELLPDQARFDDLEFPEPSLCGGRTAFVLADHGGRALSPEEAVRVLSDTDLGHLRLDAHESRRVSVDPVLRVLERLWRSLSADERSEFESAVRAAALLPAETDEHGKIQRVAVGDLDCYYPPRALRGAVPLGGLCFIARDVCWGTLLPKERQDVLHVQMAAWQAMFGVRDFKFPDVMRSSVLPALRLPEEGGRAEEWGELGTLQTLAAVCQLSGRTPNPSSPLPYERLGTNRALFNLSRLPVPCRTETPGRYTWEPAYRVYFGANWIGEASIEHVVRAISDAGGTSPEIPMLAPPEALIPLLERYQHLRRAADEAEDESDDEVGIDEDEEEALDTTDRDRWLSFLTWLGVNRAVRPVHFTDVEDRNSGWLTTKGLAKPRGWAFRELPAELWDPYATQVESRVGAQTSGQGTACFYAMHDLEHITPLLSEASRDRECRVAQALFAHFVHNWTQLQRFERLEVALVPEGLVPSMRAKPPRAKDDERQELGENFWLWRLRQRDFCPTSHGPKAPGNTWVRTRELERRFSSTRGGIDCSRLLPVLDVPEDLAGGARPLQAALAVREEITASSFRPEDAATILKRLELIYRDGPNRTAIREVVRPTYRSLIELLPGQEIDKRYATGSLADQALLETNGHNEVRFTPARHVLWAERNGTRERLGNPPELWTFVHEASTNARVPLTRLFGVRVLEDQLDWAPVPGQPALDDDELGRFGEGLAELAPYLLARLSAERPAEALQQRDASTLRRLITVLVPVDALRVGCSLDGKAITKSAEPAAFADISAQRDGTRAFVKWGDEGWPPSPAEAEALATAFAEALGATHFEAFLALINAPDTATRSRILSLAGAPTDLEAARAALRDEAPEAPNGAGPEVEIPPKEPGEVVDEPPARLPEPGGFQPPEPATPLYRAGELLIEGVPVSIEGSYDGGSTGRQRWPSSHPGGGRGGGHGYGGRTDLGELDRLGMFIAMTYERNRLRRQGLPNAEIFEPALDQDQPDARVFDISSPPLISRASERSPVFRRALEYLHENGVDTQHPGCDILTIGPDPGSPVDRCIELKSSGLHARTQAMTWNEWKTAQSDALRSRFYLYLAGNLRSDLPDAKPFLRTVQDPYQTMRSQEQEETRTRRVVLYVSEFGRAKELELGVAAQDGGTAET